MLFGSFRRRRNSRKEAGYLYLALLLAVTLMVIAAVALAPGIAQQIKRDRENEMIHRGVEYSRAIRKFYKKFGRYPASVEQLENTNNMRFLRHRYKDPMTANGEWRVLHYGDVQMGQFGQVGQAVGTSANSQFNPGSSFGQSSSFGQNSSFGQGSSFGQSSSFGQNSSFGQGSSFGQQGSSLGQASPAGQTGSSDYHGPSGGQAPGSDNAQSASGNKGTSSNSSSDSSNSSSDQNVQTTGSSNSSSGFGTSTTGSGNLGALGGGAMIGVASLSPKTSIHVFDEKNHYKDWRFIYDPTQDRGGLITGPYSTKTPLGFAGQGQVMPNNTQSPSPGSTGSPSFSNPNSGTMNSMTPSMPPDTASPK